MSESNYKEKIQALYRSGALSPTFLHAHLSSPPSYVTVYRWLNNLAKAPAHRWAEMYAIATGHLEQLAPSSSEKAKELALLVIEDPNSSQESRKLASQLIREEMLRYSE